MSKDLTLYTGKLNYRDIDFTFVFDRNELRLIPPKDKEHEIEWEWRKKPIGNGAFTLGDPVPVGVDSLIGDCNETRQRIVFLPRQGSNISFYNSTLVISLSAYIICKYSRDSIDRISFSCPEINYIHPINQAIELKLSADEFQSDGIVTVSTLNFDQTTTEKQSFIVDGKEIKAYFGIQRSVSTNIHKPPLQLESSLMFEFDAIDDYMFIYRLWGIAKEFIRFLCYRKNVFIPKVELSAPYENGKHENYATMYLIDEDDEIEIETLKKERYIEQVRISGHEGQILSDISEDKLYLRHLPSSYLSGRHIDASRFIMITAAFEWEFHRLYPNGVKKSAETIEAEKVVSECIQEHIDGTSGRQKKIYKFLKKLIKSDSLQAEIVQMGKDFSKIVGVFGNHLYHMNEQELDYTEMGQRLSDQRNHFAHGDLDKDFIGLSLLDLIYLEYIVYAMQLKYYEINNTEIQKAINKLFHIGFAL